MIVPSRLFRAEAIKWRKSWLLVTVILTPVCQTGFLFLILWFSEYLVTRFKPCFEFWVELNLLAWALVSMPMMIALVCELSWTQETDASSWSHLLAQPVPRSAHYLVKWLGHLVLTAASHGLLLVLVWCLGLLLEAHFPALAGGVAWNTLLHFGGYTLVASVVLVSFHTWLSSRRIGLGIALAAGFIGSWACVQLAGKTVWIQLLPWGMSSRVATFFDRWDRIIPWELATASLLCALVWMVMGLADFRRLNEPR